MDVLRELLPGGGPGLPEPGELVDSLEQATAERVVAELDAIHGQDRKPGGKAAVLRQVEQGRYQLAPGQVASPAKDDEQRRIELFRIPHSACASSQDV